MSGLLFGIHYGLLIGATFDSLRLIRSAIKPQMKIEKRRVSQNEGLRKPFKLQSMVQILHKFLSD